MFKVILICAAFAGCLAAPQQPPQKGEEIAIISQTNEVNPDGAYQWAYETANGIKAQEVGTLEKSQDPQDGDVIAQQGSYSYTAPDGTPISLTYVANGAGGFQPEGAHLPVAPPIPEAIQRALDWIATQPSTTERARR